MEYKKIKGTIDFYDEASRKLRYLETRISKILQTYDYTEIITPILENTEVFVRSVGTSSDIVNKEMYSLKDRNDVSLTLRPEGTAGTVRCFVENKLYATPGLKKYYYVGPMFRYEKPQAGRYRQFTQFGVEVFGESTYLLDAEVIYSIYDIFSQLGLKNIKLIINSIGDMQSRKNYAIKLQEYFKDKLDCLCDDCKKRFDKNPMRILDCKVDKNNQILLDAPKIHDYLTLESQTYFQNLIAVLDTLKVPYSIDEKLVRGLDYYTDTVFEYIIDDDSDISGQAICAGGKYADLVKTFNGPDIPGVGYAMGLERVITVMDMQNLFTQPTTTKVTIITLDEQSKLYGMKLASEIRLANIIVNMDYKNNNLKPQFKLSERSNADYVIIIGEEERCSNVLSIKNTKTGEQIKLEKEKIINYLKEQK